MGESLDRFLGEICYQRTIIVWIFVVAAGLVVVQTPYLLFVSPGSALFVIVTMNVVGFAAFAIGSAAVIKYCDRRTVA